MNSEVILLLFAIPKRYPVRFMSPTVKINDLETAGAKYGGVWGVRGDKDQKVGQRDSGSGKF